jgi:hypothetical protein
LEGYRKLFTSIQATSHNGPLALVDGSISKEDYALAAGIVARYGQGRDADEVELTVTSAGQQVENVSIKPLTADEVIKEWHV